MTHPECVLISTPAYGLCIWRKPVLATRTQEVFKPCYATAVKCEVLHGTWICKGIGEHVRFLFYIFSDPTTITVK